jgi:hypothetical protein
LGALLHKYILNLAVFLIHQNQDNIPTHDHNKENLHT